MNIGIVGSGLIVKEFLKVSEKISEINIVALLSRKSSVEKNEILCSKYNIKNIYTDYQVMLQNTDIEVIYVALTNQLHYEYSRVALKNGKHVICEKPFTITLKEAKDLKAIAIKNNVMVFEAISTIHLQNFHHIKKYISDKALGDIKIVNCNFSKISSRYSDFKAGNILPAFDPKMYGGALMDLNCYNFHFILYLFGTPNKIEYFPNIERGIDTSGIAVFEYSDFQCVSIAAKDSNGHSGVEIQGSKGTISVNSPLSLIESFIFKDGYLNETSINENLYSSRLVNTFMEIIQIIKTQDFDYYNQLLSHTMSVVDLLEKCRLEDSE